MGDNIFEEDDTFEPEVKEDIGVDEAPEQSSAPEEVEDPVEDLDVVPQSSEEAISNLDFLSRMLHKNLRGLIKPYFNYLRSKFSKELLELFVDIVDKLSDDLITPEVLNAILPDMGVTDVRRDIIVNNYRLINEDTTRCLERSTYDRFREIVYRAYFEKVNTGSAVETLEKIQSGDFFIPPFGVMNSDSFTQVDFGKFDLQSIVDDLGKPLYSHFKELNDMSPIKGYIPSQVTMVIGPPGCLGPGTRIRDKHGDIVTLFTLNQRHEASSVKTLNFSTGEVYWSWNNMGCRKTGEETEFTQFTVSTNPDQEILCTHEHQFLVVDPIKGSKWVKAKDLRIGDILYSTPGERYVRVNTIGVYQFHKPFPVYDICDAENHNYFINAGSEDICTHNSGKTLFMMTEAVEAIKQGKKVLYAAIGDLKPFDFVSRICSMLLKIPMTKTALSVESNWKAACMMYPQLATNLRVQFISPNKYTPEQWLKMNEQLGNVDNYDVFFIDYDTNFNTEKDSMYAKGDEVYTMAYTLSQHAGKYVFVGSQPKIGNWKDQELGLESASESSRKQQIVDVMISLSHDRNVRNPRNHLGIINVPKNRRGGTTKFKYILDPTGVMESIPDAAYMMFREEEFPISVINTENRDLTTKYVPIKQAEKEAVLVDAGEKPKALESSNAESRGSVFEEVD